MLYRAAQYPELRVRPDSVKYLILQWHESIGVTLLSSLGMAEIVVNATVDHDQPRALPDAVRTLDDIVYVGNILAGGHFSWSAEDAGVNDTMASVANQNFAELLPEIDADFREMQAVFA